MCTVAIYSRVAFLGGTESQSQLRGGDRTYSAAIKSWPLIRANGGAAVEGIDKTLNIGFG